MTLQILVYIFVIGAGLGLAVPYGRFMARVFGGERNLLTPVIRPVERWVYKVCGIDENTEMTLKTYILTLLVFELLGAILVFAVMMLQGVLPLNPQEHPALRWDRALNLAVSFVTNSNYQPYVGERELTYMSYMLGVLVQDIISPSVGLAVIVTMARCFSRGSSPTIGNFWVDLIRGMLYIWVPLTLLLVFPLISQGVIQNMNAYVVAHPLEGGEQLIPGGPAGIITAFKLLAEDGNAWSGVSAAHPFETPTGLSLYLHMGYILFVPAAITFMVGWLTKNRKITVALFSTMLLLFALSMPLPFLGEFGGNPLLQQLGVQGGVSMEGKEVRFTLFEHVVFLVTAMAPANGSTLAQLSSVMPLSILQVIFNLGIGAPIFGCIGTGSLTMIHYFIVSMFLAGLMTGRTPELIGKKLDLREVVLACTSFLMSSFTALGFSAIALSTPAGLAAMSNTGPRGLTEVVYVFISTSINNGSFMAGLDVTQPFYNLATILPMLGGRFSTLIVGLLIGGSIARKGKIPISAASLPVASPLFIIFVIFVIIILSGLSFFPVLTLGPILEQLMMQAGITF
ncbi:MAG: potassium-transporting ATPase subunit KdpA [Chloroflexota bacterium]|nr:potassium-transporting ATPase subunit KdpA [Chloroflexota bacterium]